MPIPYAVRAKLQEADRAIARLNQIENERAAKPFTDEMAGNLMVILGYMPMTEWPEIAKVAYRHAKAKHPGSCAFYDAIRKGTI